MANGFTWMVKEDKATLREFAIGLTADRDGKTAVIKREVDAYFRRAVAEAQQALYDAERMTLTEAAELARVDREKNQKAKTECSSAQRLYRERYEAMRAQVEAWAPPTPKHDWLKEAMLREIAAAIKFDCSADLSYIAHLDSPEKTAEATKAARVEFARAHLASRKADLEEQERSVAEQNAWNKALLDSLPKEEVSK